MTIPSTLTIPLVPLAWTLMAVFVIFTQTREAMRYIPKGQPRTKFLMAMVAVGLWVHVATFQWFKH